MGALASLLWLAAVSSQSPPGYEPIPELSDEFAGSLLDPAKWSTARAVLGWPGRQPGLFDPANVVVANGSLQLWARSARRDSSWPAGFDNYTTAAVRSLHSVREGYFQIRWRSGSSGISSSWWFHANNGSAWTEIDVFETTGRTHVPPGEDPGDPERCGNTPLGSCRTGCPANRSGTCGPERRPFAPDGPSCNLCQCNVHNTPCSRGGAKDTDLPSHVHVFKLPRTTVDELPAKCGCKEARPGQAPCSKPASFSGASAWRDGFHIAAMNWTTDSSGVSLIQVAIDGQLVNSIRSPCLVQEVGMDFDRETMPGWMSLPPPASLPDQPFEVDWVRSWRRAASSGAEDRMNSRRVEVSKIANEACQANLCHRCVLNGTEPAGNCCLSSWRCVYDSVFEYNVCKPPKEWLCGTAA